MRQIHLQPHGGRLRTESASPLQTSIYHRCVNHITAAAAAAAACSESVRVLPSGQPPAARRAETPTSDIDRASEGAEPALTEAIAARGGPVAAVETLPAFPDFLSAVMTNIQRGGGRSQVSPGDAAAAFIFIKTHKFHREFHRGNLEPANILIFWGLRAKPPPPSLLLPAFRALLK